MREICIEDFLMKCNPNHVERHSDSSDFESPREIPIIASKGGNHRLLSGKTCNTKHEKQTFSKHVSKISEMYNTMDLNKIKAPNIQIQDRIIDSNKYNRMRKVRPNHQNSLKKLPVNNKNRNQGDQISGYYLGNVNSKSLVREKVMPCLSTIFRRQNNCIKHMSSIEEDNINSTKKYGEAYCPNCEHRRIKKYKRHRGYSVQPVYAVEENVQGFPFKTNNDTEQLPQLNEITKTNCPDISNEISLSSESELENMNAYKYRKFLNKLKYGYEKEKEKGINYSNDNHVKNQQQQYPSKFQLKPYQVFTSSSCQAKYSSSGSEELGKMHSSSSAFWDFFASKMKKKIQKPGVSKSCDCIKPPEPCSPDNCERLKLTPENTDYYEADKPVLNTNSYCQQTDQQSSESSTSSKKKSKEPKVICKCYSKKKRDKTKKSRQSEQNETKPCQEDHDDITRAVSEKYNGEILCIHNPPCILINGCLNLPPPKTNIQGNLWPVTQSKKSSFVRMCQKMKRSKQRNEQASQYHPPFIDLQECFPEFKTEKFVQSICNHDPPCEVVHGCYKVQYDPKLQNSCIHVPMCKYLPVCLMSDKNNEISNESCTHNPKCTKLPMCSRKYITLTAKESVGTQVKARTKMVCRHRPQCFMIPKCLAQAITGDYIPYGAIPGCVHQPCCEMIPACCRKTAKEMVSVPSQYPNACRIV